jgi:adenylate kinase
MILLMGIAGSGKGTQGKLLADQGALELVSMGDVVRMYISGEQKDRMLAGELLGDKEIIEIVDKVLASLPDSNKVLLDGFPRTVAQAQWLIDQAKSGRFKIELAYHLVANKEVVKDRLLKRARVDDLDAAINERFSEYEKSTTPVIDWLKEHDVKVVKIDAERSVEAVNQDMYKHLKELQQ